MSDERDYERRRYALLQASAIVWSELCGLHYRGNDGRIAPYVEADAVAAAERLLAEIERREP